VHHFESENKIVTGIPPQRFAGKVMVTNFWDVNRVVHSKFMPTGVTINSERYVEMLQRLKARIPVHSDMQPVFRQHYNVIPLMGARTIADLSPSFHCLGPSTIHPRLVPV
jgi:hypothetical protein